MLCMDKGLIKLRSELLLYQAFPSVISLFILGHSHDPRHKSWTYSRCSLLAANYILYKIISGKKKCIFCQGMCSMSAFSEFYT